MNDFSYQLCQSLPPIICPTALFTYISMILSLGSSLSYLLPFHPGVLLRHHQVTVVVNPPDEYVTNLFLSFLNCVLHTTISTVSQYILSIFFSKPNPPCTPSYLSPLSNVPCPLKSPPRTTISNTSSVCLPSWGCLHGLLVACWTTDHYHLCSNLGVGISEGCFIFDFTSLHLGVTWPI